MCGIAGFIARPGQAVPAGLADRFSAALAHRGPDGEGRRELDGVLLVHRRLSIIDLATGAQPIAAGDGAAIIANAEIYDYLERRREIGEGHFKTRSDCEVALALYVRQGAAFAEHVRGMYAIAVHDPSRGRVVLARDPFGIKPLYIAGTPAGIAFASEPGALVKAGVVAARENASARDALLARQFTMGTDTLFAGIGRLAAGETLVIEKGAVVERRQRPALPAPTLLPADEEACLKALDAALVESVALHARADVPVGLFLSGGIDSASIMVATAKAGVAPAVAFTAAFDDPDAKDETEAAAALAAGFGVRHVAVPFAERDFWRMLPGAIAALDDAVADYAAVPTFMLAEAAAREVKCVLTGEGGDELFAGYGRYRKLMRPSWLVRGSPRRGILDGLGVLREGTSSWRAAEERARAGSRDERSTRLQAEQAFDIATWLPDDLLIKLDRTLMAHGLEGRTPFLDPRVAEVAFRLPDDFKVRGRTGKWLLRRWLKREGAEHRAFAPKQGFTVPVGAWIARRGRRFGPLVAAEPGIAAFCRPDRVEALFGAVDDRRRGLAAWTLLAYALWHKRHILGAAAEGDAFDALAARG